MNHGTRLPVAVCLACLIPLCCPPPSALAHNGKGAYAYPIAGITVDGDLSDWPDEMARYDILFQHDGDRLDGDDDLQARFRVGYSVEMNAIFVAVEVEDDSVVPGRLGEGSWDTQDGCEVYLEAQHQPRDTRPIQYQQWGPNRGVFGDRGSVNDVESAVHWGRDGYQFEWRIDLDRASDYEVEVGANTVLGFDVAIWDSDEGSSSSWVCWGSKRGKYIHSDRLGDLILVAEGASIESMLSVSGAVFEARIDEAQLQTRLYTGYQMFFTGVLAAVTLLHLLLFLFDRKSTPNFYYALYTGTIAASVFTGLQLEYAPTVDPLNVASLKDIAILVIGVVGVLFLYSIFYQKIPRACKILLGGLSATGLLLAMLSVMALMVRPLLNTLLGLLFPLLAFIIFFETVRVIVAAIVKKKEGSWIVGLGFSAFAFNVSSLITETETETEIDLTLLYWVLLPLISMSVYLARAVARTNRELKMQLVHMEELSANTRETNEALSSANQELVSTSQELDQSNQELVEKTERLEKANEEVLRANQAKSAFLANMSHEIRTPMNAVINFSNLIERGLYGEISDDLRDAVEEINSNGGNLLDLINDILDLSKIEAGALDLKLGECAPDVCVENAARSLEYDAAEKDLELVREGEGELPLIQADERRITQHVLMNLLKNGIKFTREGGKIRVGVRREGDDVLFWVADTGIGIAAEEQERIFDTFHQVDSSDSREAEGTGLGLAIPRRFVEMHGGRIWVESQVGEGATFYFTVPIEQPEPTGQHGQTTVHMRREKIET